MTGRAPCYCLSILRSKFALVAKRCLARVHHVILVHGNQYGIYVPYGVNRLDYLLIRPKPRKCSISPRSTMLLQACRNVVVSMV